MGVKRKFGERFMMQNEMRESQAHQNLLFAVPKKGRLHEKCMQLIDGAGLDHKRPDRVDVAHCKDLPVRSPLSFPMDLSSKIRNDPVHTHTHRRFPSLTTSLCADHTRLPARSRHCDICR